MMEQAVNEYLKYLNKLGETKNELFDETKKASIQVSLFKIPNIIGEKRILCKLPNPLVTDDNYPEVCLIVKDVDKTDRDYEKTIRKYQALVDKNNLGAVIKKIMPLKQINLEFRHFEAKRKLCTSFDVFLADKCLHEILFSGSKLGKEFRKRRKMPIAIDLEDTANLKDNVFEIINSTIIRLSGKGAVLDINAFLSTHAPKQAIENIDAIKKVLVENLPGGEANINSIYIKSTNQLSVPVYMNVNSNINEIKLKNNMTSGKIKKSKKLKDKLKKKSIIKKKPIGMKSLTKAATTKTKVANEAKPNKKLI